VKRLLIALLLLPSLALAQSYGPYGVFGGPVPSASLPAATLVPTNTYAFTSDLGLLVDNGASWVAASSAGSAAFNALTGGTNSTAAMVVGTGASLSFSGTGSINANKVLGLTFPALVASDCLASNSGATALVFQACGGGSSAFSAITTGTNTTATMTVGAGGTLTFASTGIVNADQVNGLTFPALVANDCLASNSGGTALVFQACAAGNAFGSITTGTNSTATMTVGTGGTLTFSGSGVLNASTLGGATFAAPGPIGSGTAGTGAFTTLSASSTVSGTGFSTYLASPPAIGGTAAAAGTFTALTATTDVALPGYATASLPTCNTGAKGQIAYTTDGTAALAFCNGTSWAGAGGTTFTITPTGCTPSAHAGSATAGTITLATGPCTSIVITPNGAIGMTAPTGFHCNVGDRTTQNAGTWIPQWGETATTTTTVTIPIPAAAGATDVISFACTPY